MRGLVDSADADSTYARVACFPRYSKNGRKEEKLNENHIKATFNTITRRKCNQKNHKHKSCLTEVNVNSSFEISFKVTQSLNKNLNIFL